MIALLILTVAGAASLVGTRLACGAAAARMARCRALAPGRLELPDNLSPEALALLGCESDLCTAPGPYTLVGRRLYCLPCAARLVLDVMVGESAGYDGGGDTDDEH